MAQNSCSLSFISRRLSGTPLFAQGMQRLHQRCGAAKASQSQSILQQARHPTTLALAKTWDLQTKRDMLHFNGATFLTRLGLHVSRRTSTNSYKLAQIHVRCNATGAEQVAVPQVPSQKKNKKGSKEGGNGPPGKKKKEVAEQLDTTSSLEDIRTLRVAKVSCSWRMDTWTLQVQVNLTRWQPTCTTNHINLVPHHKNSVKKPHTQQSTRQHGGLLDRLHQWALCCCCISNRSV
jgi:hypothetical protein